MAGSSLQNFIAAHRAKLDQEKQQMKRGSPMKLDRWALFGMYLKYILIINSDERGAVLPLYNRDGHRDKLRRERQTEYQEYLKQKEGVKHQQKYGDTSVQEKRQQLAEEREKELSRQSSRDRYRNYQSESTLSMHEGMDPYEKLRDRKRSEQRRYVMNNNDYDDVRDFRSHSMRQIDPVYRLEEEQLIERLNNNRRRRRRPQLFDNDEYRHKVHFDDIEDYDDDITMRRYKQTGQQDTHHNKHHNSQDKNDEFATKSRRSNSAPLVIKGLVMLGGEEALDAQKKRKQQYAEELRLQIQQKEKEKKQEKLERFGFNIDSTNDHTTQQSDSPGKENQAPPQQKSLSHLSPPRRRHSRDYPPSSYYHGIPPLPLDYFDYYKPYPPAPQYYPPPMFNPYYRSDVYDYPLYHHSMDQPRRSRAPDAQCSDQASRSRLHPPVEVRVTDHDQRKMADQSSHDKRSPESGKTAYRDMLRKQMKEKWAKDEQAKLEQERYDEKLRREIQEYDPWGRGGGGAPNQDNHGNIITDLRRMRKDNETNMLSGSPSTSPRTSNVVTFSDSSTKVVQRPVSEGNSQPRSSQETYKEALQQQIAEKERAKQLEKEKQKIEEKKELLRLEKQRIKLQEEYERELAQQKAKEEEARRKNEAMKREAEEKRMATLRRRNEEELKEMEQRVPQKPPTPTPVVVPVEFRSSSPPVPALQNKMSDKPQDDPFNQQLTIAAPPPRSPPVPALRSKPYDVSSTDHVNSSTQPSNYQHVEDQSSNVHGSKAADERVDVLRQLSRMRQEFENEQNKIHRQLSSSTSTTIAIKPRRIAKDVFQKKPSAPLPSASNLRAGQDVSEQFNDLKYKRTSSRLSFMKKYPAPPKSDSSLDIQQDALLRHQERGLAKLRSDNVEHPVTNSNIPLGNSTSHEHSSKNLFGDKTLLDSSVTPLPQPQTLQPLERPPSHGSLSLLSINTLEVENIAARNEERMRRLDAILNSSKTDNSDPEAVIRKFLENRDHSVLLPAQKRRASEVSLDADTRMCPVHDTHE